MPSFACVYLMIFGQMVRVHLDLQKRGGGDVGRLVAEVHGLFHQRQKTRVGISPPISART